MIRILIADDHTIVRRGLKEILLEEFPDAMITEVTEGHEMVKKAREEKFDIIISDISMPNLNGLDALKQIKEEFPKYPILMLSIHPEDQYAIRVLKAGASGYMTKDSAADELVKAVRQILLGKKYITPSLAERLVENIGNENPHLLHTTLSDREFDVMKQIASGKKVSEIADALFLSVTTVSTYRARILLKMNLKNNAEITHYALENKLV